MAAYHRVYDSRHVQADCKEPGSAPEPYARQSNMGYLYLFTRRQNGLQDSTRSRRQTGQRMPAPGYARRYARTNGRTTRKHNASGAIITGDEMVAGLIGAVPFDGGSGTAMLGAGLGT